MCDESGCGAAAAVADDALCRQAVMSSVATGSAAVGPPQRTIDARRHINPRDGSVVVPRAVAEWLHNQVAVLPEKRLMLRERDPEKYEVLLALRLSGMSDAGHWPATSDLGSEIAKSDAPTQDSEEAQWLTTRAAGDLAGVTDRAIRDWIATQRLPARRHGHTWRIRRADLQAATAAA